MREKLYFLAGETYPFHRASSLDIPSFTLRKTPRISFTLSSAISPQIIPDVARTPTRRRNSTFGLPSNSETDTDSFTISDADSDLNTDDFGVDVGKGSGDGTAGVRKTSGTRWQQHYPNVSLTPLG